MRKTLFWLLGLLLLTAVVVGCGEAEEVTEETAVEPPPADSATPANNTPSNDDFIVIATDAPNPPFTSFDSFGDVVGYNSSVVATLARLDNFDYEFVVTPYEGVLELVADYPNSDIDAVMVPLPIPDAPPTGVTYTDPYLELGQTMVVLADNDRLQTTADIGAGLKVGVVANSSSEQTAREQLGMGEADLVNEYTDPISLLTALVSETLDAVIVDSYTADHYTTLFPEQLKAVGGNGQGAWLSSKAYGFAVASTNEMLLARLNAAIAQATANRTLPQLAQAAFVPTQTFDPGESRVGTSAETFVIGVVGNLEELEPASNPDLLSWEVKNSVMSGLYRLDGESGPQPNLIAGPPEIAADGLTYTFVLRSDVVFTNGRSLSAADVKWAINRSARLGSFLVNGTLKDSNDDGFADEDAVQVIDPLTVRMVLQQPTAYFPSLLATPPFFPLDSSCYAEVADPTSRCGGIGPYTIVDWVAGESLLLQANEAWHGEPPRSETVQLVFYEDAETVRRALERFQSVDLAPNAFSYSEQMALAQQDANGDGVADFTVWSGPSFFKSYLVFEQSEPPWDSRQVRQAAAYALDREALAALFGGSRRPLNSPLPDTVPYHQPVYPERDLEQARALLLQAGYSAERPLAIFIRYENSGRYSPQEAEYANLIKQQLEETGVFQVTLEGVVWDSFRAQIAQCGYSAYLIGWPSPGQPANYMDATSWTDFFIQSTDSGFCSNYESEEMARLLEEANKATAPSVRAGVYGQMQQLWADELPTLELLQEPRRVLSLEKVTSVSFDLLGLLDYGVLVKESGE